MLRRDMALIQRIYLQEAKTQDISKVEIYKFTFSNFGICRCKNDINQILSPVFCHLMQFIKFVQ